MHRISSSLLLCPQHRIWRLHAHHLAPRSYLGPWLPYTDSWSHRCIVGFSLVAGHSYQDVLIIVAGRLAKHDSCHDTEEIDQGPRWYICGVYSPRRAHLGEGSCQEIPPLGRPAVACPRSQAPRPLCRTGDPIRRRVLCYFVDKAVNAVRLGVTVVSVVEFLESGGVG